MNGSGDMKGLKADFSVILGTTLTKQNNRETPGLSQAHP